MAKVQESFRGFVWAIEEGELSKKRVGELETLVQQYKVANEKWNKYFTYYLRAKVLKEWLSDYGRDYVRPVLAVVAAVLFVLMFFKTTAMLRAWSPSIADNAAFEKIVRAMAWHEGWTNPFVETINGADTWIATEGTIDRDSY